MKVHAKISAMLAICALIVSYIPTTYAAGNTIYVSSVGADSNSGTSSSPKKTIAAAVSASADGDTIEIKDTATMTSDLAHSTKALTIEGGTLDISAAGNLNIGGDTVFRDIIINSSAKQNVFACGYNVTMDTGVTMPNMIKLYGGGNKTTVSKTALTINSGSYYFIVSGSCGGTVNGNSAVAFNGGTVDEAVLGGNDGGGTFSGDTHVTMNGGKTQAIFGGNDGANLTGNTYITVNGGEITRRIIGGCYNDCDISFSGSTWKSSYHVIGTTNITMGAGITFGTSTVFDEQFDKGIYGGSRYYQKINGETNTIIFKDGSDYTSILAASDFINPATDLHDYLIKSGTNGETSPTSTGGRIIVTPNDGTYVSVNNGSYTNGGEANVAAGTSTVNFSYDFKLLTANTSGNTVTVNYDAENLFADPQKKDVILFAASYDANGRMAECKEYKITCPTSGTAKKDFTFTDLNGKKVKVMLSEENGAVPLAECISS